jgi:hypothetical protein
LVCLLGYSQEKAMEIPVIEADSTVYKTAYGLRIGADISKPKTKLEKLLAQPDIFETLRKVNTGAIKSYDALSAVPLLNRK